MLRILDKGIKTCDGITRRDWLRIGGIGMGGLTLADILAQKSQANVAPVRRAGKAKSVILFGLVGGPPQYDTWDPKPMAPVEIRGPFKPIASRTPGLMVGELMPKTAKLTDKIAVLRAVVTNDNAHSTSGYQIFTGVPHVPLNAENSTPRAPNIWPTLGGIVRYLKPDIGQLPSAITLPRPLINTGGFAWPGQDAGFLGRRYHPWIISCDPSDPKFKMGDLSLPEDITAFRFNDRRSLLSQVNGHLDQIQRQAQVGAFDLNSQKAFELLGSSATRGAFDLNREPASVRDRYGRGQFAQSCLLARRLVEAGVSLVQVNWTQIEGKPNFGSWDTHEVHNQAMQDFLGPIMDQCFSALIEDLEERGLLDETLVVWLGEFGRTPRFNARGGRDHWGQVFSLALAGGGVRGGVVYGASDRQGAYPMDGRVEAADLQATIFQSLGFGPDTEMRDNLGRPLPISRGKPISAIL